jgi:LysM repeat protein
MKKRLVVSAMLVALFIGLSIGPVWAAPPATHRIVHVVRWGENLTWIAGRYGTSIQAIMHANGLNNPNRIYAGQRLIIPGTAPYTGPVASDCGQVYTIQYGDTLSGIAYRLGIGMHTLVVANNIVNPSCIYAGQRLVIPCQPCTAQQPCPAPKPLVPQPPVQKPPLQGHHSPQPSGGWWYIVQPGDTVAKIAWRFGVSTWSIVQSSNLANPNLICVGQKLFIPKPKVDPVKPKPPVPGCEHLLTPRRGDVLSGTAYVKGTAEHSNFWYYKLEYRHDGLDDWHYLTGQEKQVQNDVLGTWNTTVLPNGSYYLRLVVVDRTGNYPPPCEIPVRIKN